MATEYKLSHTAEEIDTILSSAVLKGVQNLSDAEQTQIKTNIGVVEMPKVTTDDDGKILRVINGKWTAVSLEVYQGEVI